MSRLRLNRVREIGESVIEMENFYKPATRGGKTEFMYDRLLYGLLKGEYGSVERQVHARYSGKRGRIDFRIGPAKNGTFIELAIGAKANGNKTELHKLSRQLGRQRVLLLLNTSKSGTNVKALNDAFKKIKSSRGRLPTRNDVRIVVCGPIKDNTQSGSISDFSFVWRGTKSLDR
jgi:hypothetical protein